VTDGTLDWRHNNLSLFKNRCARLAIHVLVIKVLPLPPPALGIVLLDLTQMSTTDQPFESFLLIVVAFCHCCFNHFFVNWTIITEKVF